MLEAGEPRPRRLRKSDAVRKLVRENAVQVTDLIQPLFVIEGEGSTEPIGSMPGQNRLTIDELCRECRELADLGIQAVALFPSLDASLKSEDGSESCNPDTLILRAIRAVKEVVPDMQVLADIALDPYTTHGHDGVLNAEGTDVDNDSTLAILARMAVLNAEAGADFVAPSDMMDGRIGAIREALDEAGLVNCGIVAYSAKYNSAYYGPFRDAVGSSAAAGTKLLSKATYQLDPANSEQAERELMLDELEGADILMVKPAGPYLDIIRLAREGTTLPVAAYQVSGEYAQIHAAAQMGWLDLKRCRDESLLAIKRAGASLILTYFAKDWAVEQREA
ncbi:MAG: porphobilinogen synthase [Puniceicoccaceae bacterium]